MTMTAPVAVKPQQGQQEIYSSLEARKILTFMLRSPRTPITPEILPTDEIRYPDLDSIFSGRPEDAEVWLRKMIDAQILVADLVDKTPACPECGSHQLSTRYVCPKCFSYDIARSFLYEHLKCGKVASDDTFKKGDQLICPKCQTVLHNYGVEYRAVGAWYQCNNCKESFNAPSLTHVCRPKHHQFTTDRTRLVPVYQYRLNPKALSQIRREVLVYSDAVSMLEDLGFTVAAPQTIVGKSGQGHPFDIVVTVKGRWGGAKTVAIDFLSSDQMLPADSVRAFSTKVRDAKPSESYLVAVPGLTDEAKALAGKMKVTFVEGPTLKEAASALTGLSTFKT